MRVHIIGLGLIGGSLGLALRQARPSWEIVGCARRNETLKQAQEIGAIHWGTSIPAEGVANADLVIIATPVLAIPEVFAAIKGALRPGCIVTDTASTKAQVLDWATQYLPKEVEFVGGHPMAGKEQSGLQAAEADLFRDAVYVLCPSPNASARARGLVAEVAQAVGARPLVLDPAVHDRWVAAVSHLPFLLSEALIAAVAASPEWPQAQALAASGFRDVARLAAGDPRMYRDICLTNQEAIQEWLDTVLQYLARLREGVASGDGRLLEEAFRQAQQAREAWWRQSRFAPQKQQPEG
ncbi:MAG: prephenate dehydrogenase/arogenate dehydrogenase family protein [Chloroflexi bacterium]|nr:prephenate dehydrogenase/arogenate dehydrogenase family protein [Chloroflexota bacterium]